MFKQSCWLVVCCALTGLAAEPPAVERDASKPLPPTGGTAARTPLRQEMPMPKGLAQVPARPKQDLEQLKHDLQKLKSVREALAIEKSTASSVGGDTTSAAEIELLRKELERLLKERRARAAPEPMEKPPPPQPRAPLGLDLLARARALFQAGDIKDALQAYLQVDLDELPEDERPPIQYMIATCYRKLGHVDEAVKWYELVAKSSVDKELAGCADWQLKGIKWAQHFENDIKDIHKRLQAMEQP